MDTMLHNATKAYGVTLPTLKELLRKLKMEININYVVMASTVML